MNPFLDIYDNPRYNEHDCILIIMMNYSIIVDEDNNEYKSVIPSMKILNISKLSHDILNYYEESHYRNVLIMKITCFIYNYYIDIMDINMIRSLFDEVQLKIPAYYYSPFEICDQTTIIRNYYYYRYSHTDNYLLNFDFFYKKECNNNFITFLTKMKWNTKDVNEAINMAHSGLTFRMALKGDAPK
jgi:hypothetical protein